MDSENQVENKIQTMVRTLGAVETSFTINDSYNLNKNNILNSDVSNTVSNFEKMTNGRPNPPILQKIWGITDPVMV